MPHRYLPLLPLFLSGCLGSVTASLPTKTRAPANDTGSEVVFRDNQASHNRLYESRLVDGNIFVRERNNANAEWEALKTPSELHGQIKEISSDDEYIIALDQQDNIYTMTKGLRSNLDNVKWTTKWGAPLWRGDGYHLPADRLMWSISYVSPNEDGYVLSQVGARKQSIGTGCTSLFVLRPDGERITLIDPWLPNDESYEVAGPQDARGKMVSLSASGSTLFVQTEDGKLFTRTWDFDAAGSDDFFFTYHFDLSKFSDLRLKIPPFPREIPVQPWKEQTLPKGTYTSRISIHKEGKGAVRRALRVEGKSGNKLGYFTKDISDADWKFVGTSEPALLGKLPVAHAQPRPDTKMTFEGSESFAVLGDVKFSISRVHYSDTPWKLKVQTAKGETIEADLHVAHGLRTKTREHGLATPMEYYGYLRMPAKSILGEAGPLKFKMDLSKDELVIRGLLGPVVTLKAQ